MSIVPHVTTLPARSSSLETAARFAEAVARTDFVPESLRGNPAAIAAAILYGDEVGIPPMQALNKISVIKGRVSVAAETLRGQVLAAGHEMWLVESTTTRCTVAGRRRNSNEVSRVTWTMDDAKRAGIAGKQSWREYPRAMLLARASAELARAVFADAIGGLAAVEELDSEHVTTREVGSLADETPTRRTRRRQTATTPTVVEATTDSDVSQEGPTGSASTPAHSPDPGATSDPSPLPSDQAGAVPGSEPGISVAAALAAQDEPQMMNDAQRSKMMAMFREQGFNERAHRLAFTNAMLGRRIQSSSELTFDEASRLLDILDEQRRRSIDG